MRTPFARTAFLVMLGLIQIPGPGPLAGQENPFTVSYPQQGRTSIPPVFWSDTEFLRVARYYHTATLLANGCVFVTGGRSGRTPLSSCELFDPAAFGGAGAWRTRRSLVYARERHTATLLPMGVVVVTGGISTAPMRVCEAIEPTMDTSIVIEPMNDARYEHTATLIGYGRILVAGSKNFDAGLATCEVFEPLELQGPDGTLSKTRTFGHWRYTGSMHTPRGRHTATLLPDGRVLVTGGVSAYNPTTSCEIYDPQTRAWTIVAAMNSPRTGHTATLLPDGRVLVTGGKSFTEESSAEVFDPAANGGRGSWTMMQMMREGRFNHAATYHPIGVVVLTGNWVTGQGSTTCEAVDTEHDISLNPWCEAGDLHETRSNHTATLLRDGRILVIGGELGGGQGATTSCEISGSLGPLSAPVLPDRGALMLAANIPNPFPSSTTITFSLAAPGDTRLSVVSILGVEVAVLLDRRLSEGSHTAVWDGSTALGRAPAGAYLLVLRSGHAICTRMIVKAE